MRFAACIEYDGSSFCGWQYLNHAPSVQKAVEQALSKVANHPIKTICAGRTDSGVHATHQVIHFETEAIRPLRAWQMGVNANLPNTITVRWAQAVESDFHARFSALARRYRYVILNRKARPALLHQRVCWCYYPLDAKRMHEAAQVLIGEQDFSSFRAAGCQAKHARRNMQAISVTRESDFIYIDIQANAFLHHMVRNIAGSLLEIGQHRQATDWLSDLLALKDRTKAAATATSSGLYFVDVIYPELFNLPKTNDAPRFI